MMLEWNEAFMKVMDFKRKAIDLDIKFEPKVLEILETSMFFRYFTLITDSKELLSDTFKDWIRMYSDKE